MPKPEPVDPDMEKLEASAQNLELEWLKVLHVEILQEMPQDFELEHWT